MDDNINLEDEYPLILGFDDIPGTLHWIREGLDTLVGRIDTKLAKATNQRWFVLRNLAKRTSVEIERLEGWTDASPDLIAYPARNLFELSITTGYVLLSEQNCLQFTAEQEAEDVEIIKNALMLREEEPDVTVCEEMSKQHEQIMARHAGRLHEAHVSVAKMANAVDKDCLYESFYKFYSKFVHPTAWLVNTDWESSADDFRAIFLKKALVDAADVLGQIGEAFNQDR
jgi:hypothetical protein